ncbi:MAG: hypothetical protein JRD47_11705 [Deltaproteobacteria bacterium]|nr:hypothetical protein [Deltaproteobacteria bacterium]MBW2318850.1 hypothetical protein [Deltaproteobacteria bacterium]MBW2602554.1 hypothetical protein [Deltaproteobacteria bacterium]
MKTFAGFRIIAGVFTLLFAFALFSGCARLKGNTLDSEEVALIEEAEPGPIYYDFGDVLIPLELKVEKDSSFIYHAPGFTAGVLALSGRVEAGSMIRFFENNMAKDNWKLVSSFKSPRTIMFFNKANRSCIINITEKRFSTEVEIWVAPTLNGGETTLFK